MKKLMSVFLATAFLLMISCGKETADLGTEGKDLNTYVESINNSCWPSYRSECPIIYSGMPSDALRTAISGVTDEVLTSCVGEYLYCVPIGTSFRGKITYPINIEIAVVDANSVSDSGGVLYVPGPQGQATCRADSAKASKTTFKGSSTAPCAGKMRDVQIDLGRGFNCRGSYCYSSGDDYYSFGIGWSMGF